MAQKIRITDGPIRYDLKVYRGDSYARRVKLYTSIPNDTLADDELKLRVRNVSAGGATVIDLEIGSGITLDVADPMAFQFEFTPVQTRALPAGQKLEYDLQWKRAAGWTKTTHAGMVLPSGDITP